MNMSEKVGRLGHAKGCRESNFYHTAEKICGKAKVLPDNFLLRHQSRDQSLLNVLVRF